MLQRSTSTGEWVFYPRIVAPHSGAIDLEWQAPSGRGTVYASTIERKPPPQPSTNLSLIDLDEGPRMMSRVEGIAPQDVVIGMRVTARIVDGPDGNMLVFMPGDKI